jgi:2-dehydro-3-deoxy-L-rhamnonate dehydrogenase (NAD+)
MPNMQRFVGRGAIVTGGASGIGFKTAERFVSEGAIVALWDADQARLDAARASLSDRAHIFRLDVTNPAAVEQAALASNEALGRIDALVCAAGVAGKNETVVAYPVDEWKRVIDINLNGLFYCNRSIAPYMIKRGYGRVVNVASIAGKEGNPNASAYSASKAAVIGLTKSLGKELAKTGVTVNAITPATVDTPILAQVSQSHIEYMRSKIPMERFGTVEEMAAIIAWLASEECSFTTGAVFDVSGGRATY